MLLYYITGRSAFRGDESVRRHRLLEKIAEAARAGVDYIQLREKDLPTNELEKLAKDGIKVIAEEKLAAGHRPLNPVLLINSRTDVALAIASQGVHLRTHDISPAEVRKIWACGAGTPARELSPVPKISVSCHSSEEVVQAAANGADMALFAPVFEKKDAPGTLPAGLARLTQAACAKIPVLALGGINLENAKSCMEAGAAGIAAIRLFQENDIAELVDKLRR
ncbi:MAG TPA: thiamine phosphate synthase [Candidatus Sulfotelmatobacter sp.]